MTQEQLELLKYPTGIYGWPEDISDEQLEDWIAEIDSLPQKLENLVANFSDEQLDTPYRPEGWTVRQVIHHIVDSHTNGYIRFKWALTEDVPVIKPYDQAAWATLPDNQVEPKISLVALKALHLKWVVLLKLLTNEDLEKIYLHPLDNHIFKLRAVIGLYAWHGMHHYTQIEHLATRRGWV